ncbi:MAG: UDP-N-acetylmuramoyl-tripeptide--D-alanyl-D-alanine ligase, partial [Planctomycetota bacterium]
MKEFSIEALARIIGAEPTKNLRGSFARVGIDSRTTRPGDCFFAVPGDKFDGHDFVAEAFAKGAVCAVVSDDAEPHKFTGNNLLKVRNTVEALGRLAREYRQRMNFKVVAVTGSVGKTTTRQIAYHVLSRHFRVCQAPKNFNNHIGLPLTLLGAHPEDEIIIAEVGTNHLGEIAGLTRIALPDIAVITNVHPVHLEGLGDLQAITQEKLCVAEGLRPQGILIVNADFDNLPSACRAKGRSFITFGKSKAADIQAQNVTYAGTGSSFVINGSQVHLPLPGPGNVENALAAWAICSRFGLTVDDFARALPTMPPVPLRAELLQLGALTVVNDCYNANPASMKNALEILANIDSDKKRRLVFVCGDMAELGVQSR